MCQHASTCVNSTCWTCFKHCVFLQHFFFISCSLDFTEQAQNNSKLWHFLNRARKLTDALKVERGFRLSMQGKERCKEEERKRETRGAEPIHVCLIKLIGSQLYNLLRVFVKWGIFTQDLLQFIWTLRSSCAVLSQFFRSSCAVLQELSEEDRQKKEELELLVQRAQESLSPWLRKISAQHLTAPSERSLISLSAPEVFDRLQLLASRENMAACNRFFTPLETAHSENWGSGYPEISGLNAGLKHLKRSQISMFEPFIPPVHTHSQQGSLGKTYNTLSSHNQPGYELWWSAPDLLAGSELRLVSQQGLLYWFYRNKELGLSLCQGHRQIVPNSFVSCHIFLTTITIYLGDSWGHFWWIGTGLWKQNVSEIPGIIAILEGTLAMALGL